VQTTWRLLDYVAVDYREAIADGRVSIKFEYDEMSRILEVGAERLAALPRGAPSEACARAAGIAEGALHRRLRPMSLLGLGRSPSIF
jgi:high-affinity iron transporter